MEHAHHVRTTRLPLKMEQHVFIPNVKLEKFGLGTEHALNVDIISTLMRKR